MKSADLKFNLIDGYLGLLKNLSLERKMELIKKLSNSLKGKDQPGRKSANDLYGAFVSNKTADEIIAEIKGSRRFNRNLEGL